VKSLEHFHYEVALSARKSLEIRDERDRDFEQTGLLEKCGFLRFREVKVKEDIFLIQLVGIHFLENCN